MAKRPRTLINHILEHGHITAEEISRLYGYSHPPRAMRDERGLDMMWSADEVSDYDALRQYSERKRLDMAEYVKTLVRSHIRDESEEE